MAGLLSTLQSPSFRWQKMPHGILTPPYFALPFYTVFHPWEHYRAGDSFWKEGILPIPDFRMANWTTVILRTRSSYLISWSVLQICYFVGGRKGKMGCIWLLCSCDSPRVCDPVLLFVYYCHFTIIHKEAEYKCFARVIFGLLLVWLWMLVYMHTCMCLCACVCTWFFYKRGLLQMSHAL